MRICICIFCMLPFIGFGQSTNTTSKTNKWHIGVSFESGVSYRQLNYSYSYQWIKNDRNQNEVPKFSFNTGLNMRYKINSRWSVDVGLLYSNTRYSTLKESLYWETQEPDFPTHSKTVYTYHHIILPIKANYHFEIKKVKLYLTGGLSLNNFTNKTTKLITYLRNEIYQISKDQSNYGFRQDTYSIILGFGLNVPLSERFFLNIEPIYRQNFVSIINDKNAKEYLYSFGINTKVFLLMRKKN